MSLQEFARRSNTIRPLPNEPYGHQSWMISDETNGMTFEENGHHQIFNKNLMLGNIDDNSLLKLYLDDPQRLAHLYDMAEREPELRGVLGIVYEGCLGTIYMTRNKGGFERMAQLVAGRGLGNMQQQGFGQDQQMIAEGGMNPNNVVKEGGGIINSWKDKFKKKYYDGNEQK